MLNVFSLVTFTFQFYPPKSLKMALRRDCSRNVNIKKILKISYFCYKRKDIPVKCFSFHKVGVCSRNSRSFLQL